MMSTEEERELTKHRVQIDMSSRALNQLDEIRKRIDAGSRAEVVRNALRVYAYILQERDRGFEVSLLKRMNDREVEVVLPGVGLD